MKKTLDLDLDQLPVAPLDGDYQAAYERARAMALSRGRWLAWSIRGMVAISAATIVVVISGLVLLANVIPLSKTIGSISDGSTSAAVTARQARAETRYLLCYRAPAVATTEKRSDVRSVCDGYTTLDEAYKTEGVPPR